MKNWLAACWLLVGILFSGCSKETPEPKTPSATRPSPTPQNVAPTPPEPPESPIASTTDDQMTPEEEQWMKSFGRANDAMRFALKSDLKDSVSRANARATLTQARLELASAPMSERQVQIGIPAVSSLMEDALSEMHLGVKLLDIAYEFGDMETAEKAKQHFANSKRLWDSAADRINTLSK